MRFYPGQIIPEINDEMAQAIMLSYLTLEMHEDLERREMREAQESFVQNVDRGEK